MTRTVKMPIRRMRIDIRIRTTYILKRYRPIGGVGWFILFKDTYHSAAVHTAHDLAVF
jgi:hypothetical protein